MAVRIPQDTSYGLSQAILGVTPSPIISTRNPVARDRAQLGQIWINRTTGGCFFLTNIAANAYTWYAAASAVANLTSAGFVTATGGGGVGLVATAGGLTVNAGGAAITGLTAITGNETVSGSLIVGTTITATAGAITSGGAVVAATTMTCGTGLTVTAGGATITAGGLTVTAGLTSLAAGLTLAGATNINTASASATNIGFGGTGTLSMGNIVAGTIMYGQDITLRLGDNAGARKISITDSAAAEVAFIDSNGDTSVLNIDVAGDATVTGDVFANAFICGPAGPAIFAGVGDPAGAAPKGSLYIKTNAALTTDRLWIATAVGVWTFFTSNA